MGISLKKSFMSFSVENSNLFSFNADVNWQPGSSRPYGYPRQPVL